MVVNHTCHLTLHKALIHIKQVVVDQSNFFYRISRGVLLTELIVEIKVVLRYLCVGKVFYDFQVAKEIGAVAIDHRNPSLVQLN